MFHISVTRIRHIYFVHYNVCIQYKLWYTVITTYYMHVLYINSFYSPSTSRTFHVTCFTSHSMKSLGAVEPIIFDPIQSETCLLQPFVKPIGYWQFSVQLKRLNYCLRKISFLLICRGRYLPTQLGWWARISWLDMTGCAKSVGYCSRQWLDLKTDIDFQTLLNFLSCVWNRYQVIVRLAYWQWKAINPQAKCKMSGLLTCPDYPGCDECNFLST